MEKKNSHQNPEFKSAEVEETTAKKQQKDKFADIAMYLYKPYHFAFLIAGIIIFITGYLLFLFTHQPDQLLFTVENKKRMLLAVFLSALAVAAIYMGSKGKRAIGSSIAIVLALGLCYLPWHYKDAYRKERDALKNAKFIEQIRDSVSPEEIEKIKIAQQQGRAVTEIDFFKANIFHEKIASLSAEDTDKEVLALVVDNMQPAFSGDIVNFFESTLGEDVPITHYRTKFPIDENPASVFVFQYRSGKRAKIDLLLRVFLNPVHKTEIDNVLQVSLNPLSVATLPSKSVLNSKPVRERTHTYVSLLGNFVLADQLFSLRFLQTTEKVVFAHDILSKMHKLLQVRDLEFKTEVVQTISHWVNLIEEQSIEIDGIDPLMNELNTTLIEQMMPVIEAGEDLPEPIFAYMVKYQVPGSEDLLFYKWSQSPLLSEGLMVRAGSLAQVAIEKNLHQLNELQTISACNILSKIGTKSIIAKLKELADSVQTEKIRHSLRSTIDVIENRP